MARPHHRRRLALVVLLGAAGLAVVSFPFRARWWGGWTLAIAEAGVIGGLADWFAVTALFRHPLGLPIPHTAIIPANWQLMAKRVGTMVGDRVLTQDYVIEEIRRLDLAAFLARAAERVTREDLDALTRGLGRWLVEDLRPATIGELLSLLRDILVRSPIAPVLAEALEAANKHGWDQRLADVLARAVGEALDRPAFRRILDDLVDDVLARYRDSGLKPRVVIGIANLVGLIDRDRIVIALHAGLKNVADDPDHPFRQRLLQTVAELPARLRSDPELAARVEAAKTELLESAAVQQFLHDAASGIHRAILQDLEAPRSETVAWVTARLEDFRRTLTADAAFRDKLDHWIKTHAIDQVKRHHGQIAAFIEKGIHVLGPEGAVRLIEEHAGDDLQYIRVNGTIVGGLAGGGIYGLHLLLRML